MKLEKVGESTSEVEVLNISGQGFWLFVQGQEYFLSFKDFPWFKNATISLILNVKLPGPTHLYWPDLDVDLELESIRFPERYPLIYKKNL